MRWIMEKNYTKKLAAFLSIPATGVDGFRHGVIAAIMDMENLKLVLLLVQSGVCFDDILAQSTGVRSEKFLKSLLEYGLDQDIFRQLSGRIGTLILERAMDFTDEKLIVRLLNTPVSPELLSGEPGGRLLRLVVKQGHLQASKILIQKGCELDTYSSNHENNSTALWLAVSRGHIDIVKCLVEAGANLDMWSSNQRGDPERPLALAVKRGQREIITSLIEGGAGLGCLISGCDIFRWSSENNANVYRHLCTLTGRDGSVERSKNTLTVAKIVEEADRGPGPFATFQCERQAELSDQLLEEALMSAVKKQKFDATSTLLYAGVDPNAPKTDEKQPPIYHTLWFEPEDEYSDPNNDILQLLLDSGADPNHEEVIRNLVLTVSDFAEFEVFEMILNGGLDIEKYGPRLLVDAVYYHVTDIVAALVDNGVSPNSYSRSHGGMTALQTAALRGQIDCINYFLQHGGDVNKPASRFEGLTALQAACQSHKTQTARYLLEKGADVNAPPSIRGGITALEASLRNENTDLFELLLEKGARIDQPSSRSGRILRSLIEQKPLTKACSHSYPSPSMPVPTPTRCQPSGLVAGTNTKGQPCS